jgi:hypothetical protein
VYAEIEHHQKITPVGFGAHDDRFERQPRCHSNTTAEQRRRCDRLSYRPDFGTYSARARRGGHRLVSRHRLVILDGAVIRALVTADVADLFRLGAP